MIYLKKNIKITKMIKKNYKKKNLKIEKMIINKDIININNNSNIDKKQRKKDINPKGILKMSEINIIKMINKKIDREITNKKEIIKEVVVVSGIDKNNKIKVVNKIIRTRIKIKYMKKRMSNSSKDNLKSNKNSIIINKIRKPEMIINLIYKEDG